jgi:heat shock protein HslJ
MLKFCSIFLLLSCLFACAIVKPSKHLTLYVSENTVTCYAGELLKQCLLVKYTSEQAEWEYFYDDIDGFDYQRGTAYQIQVKVDEVSKPPADASSMRYTLVNIVSQTRIAPSEHVAETAEQTNPKSKGLPLTDSQWIIEYFNNPGLEVVTKNCHLTIDRKTQAVSGSDGCNALFGQAVVAGDSLSFTGMGSTKKMCQSMEQPSLFNQNLSQVNRYKIVGGELFLYMDDTLLMTLESFR